MLENPGSRVAQAVGNGAEALNALLVRTPPGLLCLDVNMPIMSGLEALEAARQMCPETAVVMVTGCADRAFVTQAASLGARATSSKAAAPAYVENFPLFSVVAPRKTCAPMKACSHYREGDSPSRVLSTARHRTRLYRYLAHQWRRPPGQKELYRDIWLRVINARADYEVSASSAPGSTASPPPADRPLPHACPRKLRAWEAEGESIEDYPAPASATRRPRSNVYS